MSLFCNNPGIFCDSTAQMPVRKLPIVAATQWFVVSRTRVAIVSAWLTTFWEFPGVVRARDTIKALARMLLPRSAASAELNGGLQQPNSPAFYLGAIIVGLALISGFGTYLILTGLTPIVPTNFVVRSILLIDLFLVTAMLVVIALQVLELWRARLRHAAGARLHVNIVGLFSIIAVLPAIILALFASASLNRALDHLFSRGTENIIVNSLVVAQAYLQEHGQVIRSDVLAMTNDMEERASLFRTDPEQFQLQLFQQAQLRNLPGAYLIDGRGAVLSAPPLAPKYNSPPRPLMTMAATGDVVIVPPHDGLDQVGAVQKISSLPDTYLYVVREVNGAVIEQVRAAEKHETEFRQMQDRRAGTQIAYGLMHMELALTLLLAAIWAGMWFANILVSPIRRLIGAAQLVSQGNLDVRLPYRQSEGDMAQLSETFNTMTSELKKQRDDLVSFNGQIAERGRFIEAVLSGVTAGVIGLDASGKITLVNRSALQLLGRETGSLTGRSFAQVLPEMAHVLGQAQANSKRDRTQEQVDLTISGAERHFIVQVTREHSGDRDYGFVVTIDDITGLVTAQRTSAWADVARRIAHEIKNPLTPIQLSAERLKRKYGHVIQNDREVFEKCTDTIIRQVGDLGRMVDEFSSFARMPKALMEAQNVGEVVSQTVDLYQLSQSDIDFKVTLPTEPVVMFCDRRLLSQALTNLVKNATEAIQAAKEQAGEGSAYRGQIEASVSTTGAKVIVSVIDNGCGLPKKDRNRLVEPYMTTRAKGTGIGLAVVHRVTEQHGGTLLLEDAPVTPERATGAAVRMVLPILQSAADSEPKSAQFGPVRNEQAAE
jgi:two-component system, NtrC family, nitrogen regulation sensor histidine kinase NtrY